MKSCDLCLQPVADPSCYVRRPGGERPACRSCWEQLILDPRHVVKTLEEAGRAPRPGSSGR